MSFMIVELIQYFFLQMILNRVTKILKLLSRSKLSVHRFFTQRYKIPLEKTTLDSKLSTTQLSSTNKTSDNIIHRDELEPLMSKLGVSTQSDGEKLPEMLNSDDLFNIFEDEEPRLDELKEAFDVFDENRDGFIDAGELQRVISVLGLKGRTEVEDCRKLIGAFDENADGRIDIDEFMKFMEKSL